jgi:drug/metabolite transporter (DMT)-like permease
MYQRGLWCRAESGRGTTVPIVLAGVAATVFGVSDFLGGTAARRVPSAVVAMLAQMAGLLALGLIMVVIPAAVLPSALGWGLLAGLAGGIGVPLLYRGLAQGPMNVVAPLTALTSAAVPVAAGALLGERPSVQAWMGITLAVIAGVVVGVSLEPSADRDDTDGGDSADGADSADGGDAAGASATGGRRDAVRGVAMALFAGVCFGGFFVLLAQADPVAGLWPVTAAKVAGSLVAGVALLGALRAGGLAGGPGPLGAGGWRLAVLGGVLDAVANALYLLAAHHGQLSVVGAVVALYPASTVLLARVLHGEKIGPLQLVGLLLAVPALVLVTSG